MLIMLFCRVYGITISWSSVLSLPSNLPSYTPMISKLLPPMRIFCPSGLIAPKKYFRMVSPMTHTRERLVQSASEISRPAEIVWLVTSP